MKTWLFTTFEDSERAYKGNLGYRDEVQFVYRFDSAVPNHKQVDVGDLVVLRGRRRVIGTAEIQELIRLDGDKTQQRCPKCQDTRIKERKGLSPRFRCSCGAEFESPEISTVPCRHYEAHFGESFCPLEEQDLTVDTFWRMAPRLNKQLAILELDSAQVASVLKAAAGKTSRPDDFPAMLRIYEGARVAVLVSRIERDPRARKVCIAHYGSRCAACGFSFKEKYGSLGDGVIEVHHLEPIGMAASERQIDPVKDLRPLCANCHTIAHRRSPPLTIEEIKSVIVSTKQTQAVPS